MRAAAEDVEAEGGTALTVPVDVADHAAVHAAACRVEERFGPFHVWINAAFATTFAPFSELEPHEFHRVTDVTYHGFVHGTRAALEVMLPRDQGTIVQTGSVLGYRGVPCSPRTAAPNTRSGASPSRCGANCCTTAAGCA